MISTSAEAFLATYQSKRTRDGYRTALRRLWDRVGDPEHANMDEVSRAADSYRDELGVPSWNVMISAWRAYYRYLVAAGTVERDPTARLRTRPTPQPQRPMPTREEVRAIWKVLLSPDAWDAGSEVQRELILRDRAIMAMLAGCGIRVSELCSLNVGHFDPETRSARWTGKGDRPRWAQLPESAWRHIQPVLNRGATKPFVYQIRQGGRRSRLTRRQITPILRYICRCARVPAYTAHCFRRFAITSALDAGMPIRDVARAVGHRSVTTTEAYDQHRTAPVVLKGVEVPWQ